MFCTPNSEGSFHRPLPIKSNIFAKITNSSELVDTDFSMSSRKLSSNRRSGKRRTERPTEEIRFIRTVETDLPSYSPAYSNFVPPTVTCNFPGGDCTSFHPDPETATATAAAKQPTSGCSIHFQIPVARSPARFFLYPAEHLASGCSIIHG